LASGLKIANTLPKRKR